MRGDWHIAQVNIALPREPLDSPPWPSSSRASNRSMRSPTPRLASSGDSPTTPATPPRSGLRRRAPDHQHVCLGFDRGPMGVRVLRRHLEVMRRRREWMTRIAETYLALWWLPARAADDRRRPPAPRPPPDPRPDPGCVHVQAPLPAAGGRDGAAPGPSTRRRGSHSGQLVGARRPRICDQGRKVTRARGPMRTHSSRSTLGGRQTDDHRDPFESGGDR